MTTVPAATTDHPNSAASDAQLKFLVVYFSRTGNTRRLANKIAIALRAELDEITEPANRNGILGYLRSGNEAWFHWRPRILPPAKDAGDFDVVVVGTPVWRASLSSPVRTYLKDNAAKFRSVAFFCTMGQFGSRRVFRQMQRLCAKAPVATLALTEHQLASVDISGLVRAFAEHLQGPAAGRRLHSAAVMPDSGVASRSTSAKRGRMP